ncbi:hypothetical protein CJ673_10510 [Aliarcobacter cryaerophilus]|uniref:Uncharacterized protein n=1 Tax=Aliarcobacter cryaerophilus TaxID=28198 RepID=A0A2S9T112_9BACT|nr:hypothetical protein [Aliarcobacter cryaerophilus]PRM92511.1 hypothetical protein CJ673_10510 [Aliarcobacter cryaerophilus]
MGELKIEYSDKKITPFGGMKLLKDFMDKTRVIDYLQSVNLPQGYSNAAYDPVDIVQGFWLAIFTGAFNMYGYYKCPKCNEFTMEFNLIALCD